MSAVTARIRTSSEGGFQTTAATETSRHVPLETQTLRTETYAGIFTPVGTASEAETRDTKTISRETKTMPYKFMIVVNNPLEISATSSSTAIMGMITDETVMGSDHREAALDILCMDGSSEEGKMIMTDVLTLTHTSAEAENMTLTLERSIFSDISFPAITTSSTPDPDSTAPTKAWVAYTITDIELINCSLIETETTAIIPGRSDTNHSPTKGIEALSSLEMSALPNSTQAKSHTIKNTTSVKTWSTTSTTGSVIPGERETTIKATTPNGALVAVSTDSLEETAISHMEVSESVTISIEAESTTSKVITSAISSPTVHNSSEETTIKSATPSETLKTNSTTSRTFPTSRGPLLSVHLTTANSSGAANITLTKTTNSAKTPKIASTTRGKLPTAMAQTNLTTKDGDGGFFLLRLSVASPEDLTNSRVAERLMRQLRHELHAHMLPIQVSLLSIRKN
ncbi:PREDICTED: mucin-20 [Chrysochloris asiatica]|uniref:Mucin-20 n=1 Tax=Chrysochloris asiatica TaxID=185453 RepID=A0A9B0TZF5_CHRAS|nr:PREDICTED: mucin-20 [Chrysochloris asiatica]